MTNKQLGRFWRQLVNWKKSIEQAKELEVELDSGIKDVEETDENDLMDKQNIIDFQEKRKNHHEFLLREINRALEKINQGTFGLCEETEEEIDIKRLQANPIARFSLEAQMLKEISK